MNFQLGVEEFRGWRIFAWAAMLSIALAACNGKPSKPPPEAVLQINTRMHSASINGVAVSPDESLFVTISSDKTARIWSLPDGEPVRMLRVPIGPGEKGILNAVAISPDGRTVALGGQTKGKDGGYNVYLFDISSGKMTRVLGDLPNSINKLAYSRDGRYLAAGLSDKGGMRVWSIPGFDKVRVDNVYGGSVHGMDFATDGRLVTSSVDGFIRLYAPDLTLITRAKTHKEETPGPLAFSPDGKHIAVFPYQGFILDIAIHSGSDLSLIRKNSDYKKTYFAAAWSKDGRYVFAGGWPDDSEGRHILVRWESPSYIKTEKFPVSDNTIFGLAPLKNGNLLFVAADPLMGVIDPAGNVLWQRKGEAADFRGIGQALRVSEDGKTVDFALMPQGKQPVRFSVDSARLTRDPEPDDSLKPPSTSGKGVYLKKGEKPEFGGNALELDKWERWHGAVVVPGSNHLLLATDNYIRLFDKEGSLVRKTKVSTVWGINVSVDGRLVVAAHDNTIRWYRVSDGEELLALFTNGDGSQWVAWTPKGYFMASQNAADLMGWQVNRGDEEVPDFYSFSYFADKLGRPDVVKRVLDTLDEDEALRLADDEK